MESIILKPVIIGAHSLCPQLSPDLFSKSIIEQPSVPLPPSAHGADFFVPLFIFGRGPWVDARLPQPEAPPERRRETGQPLAPLFSSPCQRCMAYFIQEKRRESEMLLGGWGFLQDLKNT